MFVSSVLTSGQHDAEMDLANLMFHYVQIFNVLSMFHSDAKMDYVLVLNSSAIMPPMAVPSTHLTSVGMEIVWLLLLHVLLLRPALIPVSLVPMDPVLLMLLNVLLQQDVPLAVSDALMVVVFQMMDKKTFVSLAWHLSMFALLIDLIDVMMDTVQCLHPLVP